MVELFSDPEHEIDLDRTQCVRRRVDSGLYDDLHTSSEPIQAIVDILEPIVNGHGDHKDSQCSSSRPGRT